MSGVIDVRRRTSTKPSFGILDVAVCLLIVTSIALYDVKLVFLGIQAVAFSVIAVYVLGNPRSVRGPLVYYLLWFLAFVAYGALSYLWAVRENVTAISVTFSVVQVGLIAFCIMFYAAYRGAIDRILYAFVASALVFCVRFFLTVPSSVWGQAERFKDYGVFGSNIPAMVMAYSSIILIWMCFFREQRLKHKIPAITLVVLSMFISILMGTRKSLLIFGICVLLFVLGSAKNPLKLGSRLLMVGGVVVAAYFVLMNVDILYNSIGYRLESLFAFFDGGDADASTVSRANHIVEALHLFREHPILGAGQDGYRYTTSILTYSHNNYVELLANLGLVGFSLYYLIYGWVAIRSVRLFKRNMLPLTFVIAILITDIAVVSYSTEIVYVLLGIIVSIIFLSGKEEPQDVRL